MFIVFEAVPHALATFSIKSPLLVLAIAAKYELDMPIAAQVLRVIRDGDDAHDVMAALLDQPITAENE